MASTISKSCAPTAFPNANRTKSPPAAPVASIADNPVTLAAFVGIPPSNPVLFGTTTLNPGTREAAACNISSPTNAGASCAIKVGISCSLSPGVFIN